MDYKALQEKLDRIAQGEPVNENEKVITTCGSGVSACVIALSYYRIGNEDIPVYDGSWSEWASKNMKINKF